MKLKDLNKIKTEEEARQIAINFQEWNSKENLSYSELVEYSDYFGRLSKKFNF